ncbi:hypothetical protein GCM10017781_04140 [Deinococcus metalli]|uniref:Uncharacterized protein n=1 Tax=Deinococcus metalli TaxID=1141878 RepID=A0ABQ3JHB6_9DEIO|nr:hypothetical protein GCM10017781_04140 [Deinococcus metalli]
MGASGLELSAIGHTEAVALRAEAGDQGIDVGGCAPHGLVSDAERVGKDAGIPDGRAEGGEFSPDGLVGTVLVTLEIRRHT